MKKLNLTSVPAAKTRGRPKATNEEGYAAHLKTAAQYMAKAIEELRLAELETRWENDPDARYFMNQLGELLNSDNGDAGLEPFVNSLIDEL